MRQITLLGCVFLLAGCAAVPIPPIPNVPPLEWAAQREYIEGLQSWCFDGVIQVITPTDKWSAPFNWSRLFKHYNLELTAPRAEGTVDMAGIARKPIVDLKSYSGSELKLDYVPQFPDWWLQNAESWHLPINYLQYWIRGIPAPTPPGDLNTDLRFNRHNQLIQLVQQNWLITYQNYVVVQGLQLPSQITMVYEGVQIKLLIKDWQF